MTTFKVIGKATPIHAAANAAAHNLPTIGAASPKCTLLLAHFSENAAITKFYPRPDICHWLDGFSLQEKILGRLTNINNLAAVNSIYIARVGLSVASAHEHNDVTPMRCSKGGADEYALNLPVICGQFARIPIQYNPLTKSFA